MDGGKLTAGNFLTSRCIRPNVPTISAVPWIGTINIPSQSWIDQIAGLSGTHLAAAQPCCLASRVCGTANAMQTLDVEPERAAYLRARYLSQSPCPAEEKAFSSDVYRCEVIGSQAQNNSNKIVLPSKISIQALLLAVVTRLVKVPSKTVFLGFFHELSSDQETLW